MTGSTDTESQGRFFRRLANGLEKTRRGFLQGRRGLVGERAVPDREWLDELELRLIRADIGGGSAAMIVAGLEESLKNHASGPAEVMAALHRTMVSVLGRAEQPLTVPEKRPFVILAVGVNGVGKTTTVGKLAHLLQQGGDSVLLAAGDSFRAAAIEQIQQWGARSGAPVIARHPGADPAAVLYDALQSARARGTDIVLADTAGRLHNRDDLMRELKKIVRTIRKFEPRPALEILLVVDAGTGQNAIVQAQRFHETVGVTGVALTKLDGTAKGGVAFSLTERLRLPIRYIGVGENTDDLQPFHADRFVRALLGGGP